MTWWLWVVAPVVRETENRHKAVPGLRKWSGNETPRSDAGRRAGGAPSRRGKGSLRFLYAATTGGGITESIHSAMRRCSAAVPFDFIRFARHEITAMLPRTYPRSGTIRSRDGELS